MRISTVFFFIAVLISHSFSSYFLKEGSEFLVNSYTSSDQMAPCAGSRGDGGFIVAWMSAGQDGSGYGVYGQRYNPGGTPAGSEFRANTYTGSDQIYPCIAVAPTGAFVIAWASYEQEGAGNSYGIYAQRFDAAGAMSGSEFHVNTCTTNTQEHPDIAMSANGSFVIVWVSTRQDGTYSGIYAQRFDSSGAKIGGEFLVNTNHLCDKYTPAVAMNSSGRFVITWTSWQEGSDRGIYAQRFDSSGAAIGGEFLVNTYTENCQYNSDIAMGTDGRFVITWESYSWEGPHFGIFAQRFDSGGVKIGPELHVNTYTAYNQSSPSVALAKDNGFMITWQSNWLDGDYDGIGSQWFDSSGTANYGEITINTDTLGYQWNPAIAARGNGYIISWIGGNKDFSGYGIAGQMIRQGTVGATLTSPNGGERWAVGDTKDILWIPAGGAAEKVNLYYSVNSGPFKSIVMGASNDGAYAWPVPDDTSRQCLIIIIDSISGDTLDRTDGFFDIRPVNLPPEINSPARDTALKDQLFTYLATAADSYDPVTISFIRLPGWLSDSGALVRGTPPLNAPDTSFTIMAFDGELSDTLVVTLTVFGATLASPNGGEIFVVGETREILWTPMGSPARKVRLEYSVDLAPFKTLVDSTANDGSYSWLIPNDLSKQCRMIIKDAVSGQIWDQADSLFTIRPVNQAPAITSPVRDTAIIGMPFTYLALAADSYDPVAISFSGLPGWLADSGALLRGTPPQNAPDTSFTITAFDGELYDTLAVTLVVLSTSELAYKLSPVFTNANGLYKGDLKWADINNDGCLDFVCMGKDKNNALFSRYYRSVGAASFFAQETLIGLFSGSMDVADVDRDRDLDVMQIGNQSAIGRQAKAMLYPNISGTLDSVYGSADSLMESDIIFFDYDNDGDYDAVVAGEDNSGVLKTLAYKNAMGFFTLDGGQNLTGVTEASLAFGDLDRDMDMDLVVSGFSALGPVTTVYRNAYGVFTPWQNLPGVSEGDLALADYNHDGSMDLVLTGNGVDSQLTKVFSNNGLGLLAEDTLQTLPGVYNSSVAMGDYDNNGTLDMFLSGYTGAQRFTRIYINSGNLFGPLNRGITLPPVWYGSLALADFENDGDLDLLMCGDSLGAEKVFSIYENTLAQCCHVNLPPPSPPNLLAVQTNAGEVTLSWNPVTDPEGSPVTYNIRLGRSAGEEDVVPSHSNLATGWRKLAAMGNVQTDTCWRVKELGIGRFYWSVQAVDGAYAGSPWASEKQFMILTMDAEGNSGLPVDFSLSQNYPNPFNPATTLHFAVPPRNTPGDKASLSRQTRPVTLTIYDMAGKAVRRLLAGNIGVGCHRVTWEGRDDAGKMAPSGIYFADFRSGGFAKRVKIALMK